MPVAALLLAALMSAPTAPFGLEPPDGVADNSYKRREIEGYMSRVIGEKVALVRAFESSGSQVSNYCGWLKPVAGGAVRSWSVTVWSVAPVEHELDLEDGDCGQAGDLFVADGLTVDDEETLRNKSEEWVASLDSRSGRPNKRPGRPK